MSMATLPDEDLHALASFRHALHRHPETGFEVPATARAIAERLRAAGLEVTTGVAGHGVVATLRRGSGERAIGLRADMDALPIAEANAFAHRSEIPGAFHGCGHDGHSTMLLGAAERLARADGLDGTVHFVFQPDEENGRGAQAMIDDGLFERFPMDEIHGLHNLPGLPVGCFATRTGAFTAFEERFRIRVEGRGGHASAPERAVDPIVAGSEIVLALQTIVARSLAPGDHGVVSVTEFVTDGARNVLPSTVTLCGDTRGYDDAVSDTLQRRMRAIVAGVAAAHGARGEVDCEREFEPTVNTPEETAAAVAAARRVPGAAVEAEHAPMGFSEDFARFLRHRPGCFMLLGNGTEGAHGAGLHSPGYDFNDAALPHGVEYWMRLARERLGR
jgi:hippurate hydrolase